MVQLIITVFAIALTTATILAGINYIPWWHKSAVSVEAITHSSLNQVEQAYDIATRAANGTPPGVSADADGGFSSIFVPVLKFEPAKPARYSWSYGKHAVDGSAYSGLNYVCLTPTDASAGTEGVWKGFRNAKAVFSSSQFFINSTCGVTVNAATPSSYPSNAVVTFYVAYTPGITR
jgi:hypothetical protein